MKSAVETLDATTVKLTVEVSGDELRPSIEHAYQHIGAEVQIPGFRKGKVPPRILDQRVGRAAIIEHAVNDGIPGFYGQAVNETGVRPFGQPEIEVTELPALTQPDGGLTFTAQVEVRPELTLPDLDGLTVTVDDVEVTEDDVDARLDALRERFATLVGTDRPAAEGDFVVLDLRAVIGDDEVDAVSGISYQIGAGNMLEGLDEALTGLSAGETTTFEAPLAGGERAGERASVTVTATSVKERDLPPADDDFAQLASEFDTLAELRDDLRAQVARIKDSNRAVQARDRLMQALRDAVEVPVPEGAVQAEVHRHLESEGRLEDENHRAEVTEQTRAELVERILLDTLAEQLAVKVGQNELLDFMVNAASQYGMDPTTFVQTVDRQGQLPTMVGEVARSKAVAVALRRVRVVDGAGEAVDLAAYIGTDADDEQADDADLVADGADGTDGTDGPDEDARA